MKRPNQNSGIGEMVTPLLAIDMEITSVTANACAEVWRLAEKHGASPQLAMSQSKSSPSKTLAMELIKTAQPEQSS